MYSDNATRTISTVIHRQNKAVQQQLSPIGWLNFTRGINNMIDKEAALSGMVLCIY